MWQPMALPSSPQSPILIDPVDVYYEFDEPLLFRAVIGITSFILLKIGQTQHGNRYLAANPSSKVISALAANRLSVWGALDSAFYAVMDVDATGNLVQYWRIPFSDVPNRCLPKRGVGVLSGHGWVPDTLDQSAAFFAVRFSGPQLAQGTMAFQTLKKLTTDFYDAVRKIIAPIGLESAKSGTYDFPVSEPAFGSLILALEEPKFNLGAIKKHLEDDTLDDRRVRDEFARQNFQFFDKLEELKTEATVGEITPGSADQNFRLLELLLEITPNESMPFDRVEFSANVNGNIRYVSIGLETGERLKRAHTLAAGRERSVVGTISIINNNSKTFVINTAGERQVTCRLFTQVYDQLAATPEFKTGTRLEVTGKYFRRERRDSMDVDRFPVFLA
jgi:hypothetical protein